MLRHSEIWRAIDRLADKHGLSASGLARRAGLDPTAFNKSKRRSPTGKPRWPSTESVSKVLTCTNETLGGFLALIGERSGLSVARRLPLMGYAKAGTDSHFDEEGHPAGRGWEAVDFPGGTDDHAYALKISGESMAPAYRSGDVIVVSPSAEVRRGDRVIVKLRSGEMLAREMLRKSGQKVELRSLNRGQANRTLNKKDIHWIARVLWVRQ